MIKDEDVHFHGADAREPTWAETNFFGFLQCRSEAEYRRLRAISYQSGHRQLDHLHEFGLRQHTLGSGFLRFAGLDAHSRTARPEQFPARELAQHPLPSKPNMDWHIGYDDGAGTMIDVEYRSIMLPFDIHDPAMDPMKAKALEGSRARAASSHGELRTTVISIRPATSRVGSRSRGKPYPDRLHLDDGS